MDFVSYKISDISLSIKTGKTPSTKEKLYFDGDIPWITTSDLKGQKKLDITEKTISELALIEKQAFTFEEETVIISTIGEIGKACITSKKMACNQQLTGIKVNKKIIIPDLFYYWIVKNQQLLNFKANKSIISILNNKTLRSIVISFPKDQKNQRNIIAQLDQIQNIIDFKVKTILTLENLIESTFYKMFGDVANNQKKYPKKKLKEIVKKDKVITYGIVQAGPNIEDGVPYIRSGDIKNGEVSLDKLLKTSIIIAEKFNRTKCDVGDVIFTIRATIGDVFMISDDLKGVNLSRGTALISANEKIINRYYLLCLLKSEGFKFIINKHIKGSTFKEISLQKLREIEIPIPVDLNSQKQFEKIYLDLNFQKSKIKQTIEILEELFQSVLSKAFGENNEINEESIFEDLIKQYSTEDLKNKKERLQYLINLFSENKFNDVSSYNNAKEKLFDLLDEEVIIQKIDGEDIKIDVR